MKASRAVPVRAPARGWGRSVRVGVSSGASLLLAGGAHLLGGGSLPWGSVVVAAVLLVLASATLSGRRCRFGLLLALLAVEQVLLHTLFSVAGAATMCMSSGATGTDTAMQPVAHAAHAAAGLSQSAAVGVQACAEGQAMSMGWSMVVAHLVSTVALAWVLARGEVWWWRTVAALALAGSARTVRRRRRSACVAPFASVRPATLVFSAASPRGPPLIS